MKRKNLKKTFLKGAFLENSSIEERFQKKKKIFSSLPDNKFNKKAFWLTNFIEDSVHIKDYISFF